MALYIKCYPKINISLKISKVQNGMHPLLSRFYLVCGEIYDDMVFFSLDSKDCESLDSILKDSKNIALQRKDGLYLYGNFNCDIESNLIYKAYKALKCDTKILIYVNKRIKTGAGLGGGSSNSAITLLALNMLCGLKCDNATLMQMARVLGSDVGFFVNVYSQNSDTLAESFVRDISCAAREFMESSHFIESIESKNSKLFYSANVSGFGEIIEPFYEEDLLDFTIFCNDIACDTGAVYREFDKLDSNMESKNIDLALSTKKILSRFDMQELNDLYIPATRLYPALLNVRENLSKIHKHIYFSGSGSSFFTLDL